ncbi:TlpA family protein disulfide reductase [Natronorarus salvus]|uniref:TlpA family protein disulfide reductase n=1 Tax=Natronorarus salvus TaxID=3117733 RepID=UPI002F26BFBA
MRRRDLLAGAAGLGVLGAGGTAAFGAFGTSGEVVEPATVETLDAPGSRADVLAIPTPGEVTVVEFFATWCGTCESMMPTLAEVTERAGEVRFVSVTNEPIGASTTRGDIVAWWVENDGRWPVGLDTDLELTRAFGVSVTPTTVILDAENRISRLETGRKRADEILAWIDDAR